ncbi:hypothetical protein CEXT_10031 [Caerostris extrusa]|uniref:Alpha-latrotoxin n=1 Tax=Caerostris extrusa TaxID=172846 RepID=A0AAV4Y7R5_CAEEX|nr:hypothetical protein CEXT_10031 [Caerostris extrusa]
MVAFKLNRESYVVVLQAQCVLNKTHAKKLGDKKNVNVFVLMGHFLYLKPVRLDALFVQNYSQNWVLMIILFKIGANINILDSNNESPLHNASYYGNGALAEVLLKMGADVDTPRCPTTPLYVACLFDNVECAEMLLMPMLILLDVQLHLCM